MKHRFLLVTPYLRFFFERQKRRQGGELWHGHHPPPSQPETKYINEKLARSKLDVDKVKIDITDYNTTSTNLKNQIWPYISTK